MFDPDLFDDPSHRPDILCMERFLSVEEESLLLRWTLEHVTWEQKHLRFGSREVPVPRQLAWFGDVDYTYSGLRHAAKPMPEPIRGVAQRISDWLAKQMVDARFNSVLLNHYRNGQDAIGLHADDERELGLRPVIASLSLGATRMFEFRHNSTRMKLAEPLPGGSLVVMRGDIQDHWRHGIPRDPSVTKPRVNLTFRHTGPRAAG